MCFVRLFVRFFVEFVLHFFFREGKWKKRICGVFFFFSLSPLPHSHRNIVSCFYLFFFVFFGFGFGSTSSMNPRTASKTQQPTKKKKNEEEQKEIRVFLGSHFVWCECVCVCVCVCVCTNRSEARANRVCIRVPKKWIYELFTEIQQFHRNPSPINRFVTPSSFFFYRTEYNDSHLCSLRRNRVSRWPSLINLAIKNVIQPFRFAYCENRTHDRWFTRPVLCHWAKQAYVLNDKCFKKTSFNCPR